MPISSPNTVNTFNSPSVVRAKATADWNVTNRENSSIDGNYGNFNATRVRTVRDFKNKNGDHNPDFEFNKYQRVPNGISDPRIVRGYIRRTDTSDDVGNASLNFMFNPEQITRDYVSYLDQAALDPFNTLYQSGNLVNPPSFVNFTFSLFFDRQDDIAAGAKWSTSSGPSTDSSEIGCLIDYQFFDLVVRNVVPSQKAGNAVPDNGVMMVNPKDITVVFSPQLTVQGRPTNARVNFLKFNHLMVPMRMQIDLTLIITYFGPLRSPYGLDTFKARKRYDSLVSYKDVIEEGFTTEDVNNAVSNYKTAADKKEAESGKGSASGQWLGQFIAAQASNSTATASGQVAGADVSATPMNDVARAQAVANAIQLGKGSAYSLIARGGEGGKVCFCPTVPTLPTLVTALPEVEPSETPLTFDSSGLVWAAYNSIGAGKILAGTDYAPTVTQVVDYQNQTGWTTMPIIVRAGVKSSTVLGQIKDTIESGDVLVQRRGGRGSMAIFNRWADDEKTTAEVVECRPGRGGGVDGTHTVSIDYLCKFQWITRPVYAGAQSLARSIL